MTTSPVTTITDELLIEIEASAVSVKGWTMREYFQEPEEGVLPEDWEWFVGTIDEDDNIYPLLHVNAHQYDSEDSEKLAKYYALVNRDNVLAMAAELRTLRAENAALKAESETWEMRACKEATACVELCAELESCRRDKFDSALKIRDTGNVVFGGKDAIKQMSSIIKQRDELLDSLVDIFETVEYAVEDITGCYYLDSSQRDRARAAIYAAMQEQDK